MTVEQEHGPSNETTRERRAYEKPSVEIVEVKLDELMAGGCKVDSGPLGACAACSNVGTS